MKSILKEYNQICKKKYVPLGFVKKDYIFLRLNGDMLQIFALKKYYGAPECTIEFGIFPMCALSPSPVGNGNYTLDELVPDMNIRYSGFRFDPKSDESITNCINIISDAIDTYILPFFDRCTDCKAALSEVYKLEKIIDRNRREILSFRGISDRAKPWQERALYDSVKYFMALKARKYGYAKYYLQHRVDYLENAIKSFELPDTPNQPEIVKIRHANSLEHYKKLLERIKLGDFDFFDDLIRSNEAEMIEFLKKEFPRILS